MDWREGSSYKNSIISGESYNTLGHKLRFPQAKKAQFVTVMGINLGFQSPKQTIN
jgi:hypothetical protein